MRERSDQSALREHAAAIGRESGPDPRLKLARMGLAPARAMKHELGGSIWMRISIAEAGRGRVGDPILAGALSPCLYPGGDTDLGSHQASDGAMAFVRCETGALSSACEPGGDFAISLVMAGPPRSHPSQGPGGLCPRSTAWLPIPDPDCISPALTIPSQTAA